jgi:hypothetical protein
LVTVLSKGQASQAIMASTTTSRATLNQITKVMNVAKAHLLFTRYYNHGNTARFTRYYARLTGAG